MGAVLIGIDWGTSNLRVMRIDDTGRVLDRRADPRGAGGLAPDEFRPTLDQVAGDWLGDGLPLRVCGMAGARGRWREVEYRPCPAGLDDLAQGLARPDALHDLAIVPGVAFAPGGVLTDVMRGEETQVMGLFGPGEAGIVVAPGTHSKWVTVEDGRIAALRTFMTGELFAAVRKATILGQGMGQPGTDPDAFRRGVERGLRDPAVTAALFSVRVESLAGRLTPEGAGDYLSGLLIGAEIAAQDGDRDARIIVAGAPDLAARYGQALALAGHGRVETADVETATALGLWRIWSATR